MFLKSLHLFTILVLIILTSCNTNTEPKKKSAVINNDNAKDTTAIQTGEVKESTKDSITKENKDTNESFVLTEENAIPFFHEYAKEHKEHKVKITTQYGSFIINLFEETPYHRANFIYLTKKGYFNNTYFHRVVKNFIIQGGNSDNIDTGRKRGKIGAYLLPPDTKKGFKHHRGTVSVPSSEIDNPHKLASPYEFFIVVQKPGAYHLDGKYTAFGKVISGMEVVDKINKLETDNREWPFVNVIMTAEIVE
ncbi:peptidylprolyl isomerase [Abyssalbus ytuae]|uniref:Peptidyl-prolyl cis-trans isomerase n=1 Tax=Abyssalbus ytuae TaxID=2926907 RepID=A0A9E7D2D0_9FLAO|nr:peptidylprolyl isomerase [Abyssalbus ytuae]UOB18038.1 peptidylprolyl isomerase [Abyssalbus ytuae]